MSFARVFLGLSLAATLVLGPGCAGESDEETGEGEAHVTAASRADLGPGLFRDDFNTYLKRDGNYSDDQIRQLVLMPTDAAISPRVSSANARSPIAPYDAAYASIKPSDFFQKGVTTPLAEKVAVDGPLENELRQNRVHIIIIPGIFGEFIPVSPFEEVFRQGGAAAAAWDAKLRALEADGERNANLVKDRQYSAAATKDVQRSMRDLIRVGSIDDADGKPLVTITYLKPEIGSLETFGTLDENADYYLPRLEKYFRISGVPEHLYVMGYSRGTATALNLVSRADREHAGWIPKLKGVIALAGVVYGSQLADAALAPGPQKEMLDATVDFVSNKLESCTATLPSPLLMTRNLGHWVAYGARAGLIAPRLGNRNAELQREGIETGFADVGRFVTFTRRVLFGDGKNVFSTTDDTSAISGVLHLNAPTREYCQNIERFKVTTKQIVKGVQTLTTDARMEWWKTHTLPSSVRYYAITGTMGDPTAPGAQVSPLALNETAYDTRSIDFRSLRGNYYDLFAASGSQLQDSQVPVQRGRFWPDLHGAAGAGGGMNASQQQALKTYFMGTLGIHHWGLSFPRAFSTRDGLEANPFPRTILLKSIGTFVAQVERVESQ